MPPICITFPPSLTDNSELFQNIVRSSGGKEIPYVEEITDAFLAEALAQKADLLLLSCDLTLKGTIASHKDLIKKLAAIQETGIQVLVIPGNHDIDGTAVAFHGDTLEKVETLVR